MTIACIGRVSVVRPAWRGGDGPPDGPIRGEAESTQSFGSHQPLLVLAAALQLAATLTGPLAWHAAFRRSGARLDRRGACARFGAGSLVNAVAPARVGGALRLALFIRTVPGARAATRGASAALSVGVARGVVIEAVAVGAAALGVVPVWTALASLAPIAAVAVVVAGARWRGLEEADVCTSASLVALAAGGALCRLSAIAFALGACGVARPVETSLLAFVGLELGGFVSFVPGNVVAPLAAGVLLSAHGVPHALATRAVIEFHLVETAVGLVFGGVATAWLVGDADRTGLRRLTHLRHRTNPSPAG